MTGRFGYSRLPSMYEDTDTPELKAEREMYAEISQSRSPQEYIEILRRYNGLGANPLIKAIEKKRHAEMLEASRKEVERQQATRRNTGRIPAREERSETWDTIESLVQGMLARPHAVQPPQQLAKAPEAVAKKPDINDQWPYNPDAIIGDGSRDYQKRFQLRPSDEGDVGGVISPIRLTPEEGSKGE